MDFELNEEERIKYFQSSFKRGLFSVYCPTKTHVKDFLQQCNKHGITKYYDNVPINKRIRYNTDGTYYKTNNVWNQITDDKDLKLIMTDLSSIAWSNETFQEWELSKDKQISSFEETILKISNNG